MAGLAEEIVAPVTKALPESIAGENFQE